MFKMTMVLQEEEAWSAMAPVKYTFPRPVPVCGDKTTKEEPELLQMHEWQVHGVGSKLNKLRRPEIQLSGDTVEDADWEMFTL
jgi:hypothetical protein